MSDEHNFDPKKFSDDVQDHAKKISDDVRSWAKKFSDDLHEEIHGNIDDQMKNTYRSWKGRRRHPMVIGLDLRARGRGGMITGGILVLVGIAFLLDHMGIIYIGNPFRFWPMLIVLVGLLNFFSHHRAWGALLMFAGIILQLNELGRIHFGWAQLWPTALIALGIFVIWSSLERRKVIVSTSTGGDPRTTLNEAVVFGGLERRMTSQDFQGGDVTAVFGGVELDLTEANIQAKEATLAITAIFGGVEIRVPPNWQVAFRGAPIFGGIEDKTRTTRVEDPANSNLKVLVITGAVIFGGLEIKN